MARSGIITVPPIVLIFLKLIPGLHVFYPTVPFWSPFDTPNSVAFGTGKGCRQMIFATNVRLMIGLFTAPYDQVPDL